MIVTREELANIYKVHVKTIDNWRKLNIPIIKVGRSIRFDTDDVEKWAKEKRGE